MQNNIDGENLNLSPLNVHFHFSKSVNVITIEISPIAKVSELIEKCKDLQKYQNISNQNLKFIFNAKNLDQNSALTLSEAGFTNNARVFVVEDTTKLLNISNDLGEEEEEDNNENMNNEEDNQSNTTQKIMDNAQLVDINIVDDNSFSQQHPYLLQNNIYQDQQQYGYDHMSNTNNINVINNNNTVNQNNNASVPATTVTLIFRFFTTAGNERGFMITIETNKPFKDALNLLKNEMKNKDATFHFDDFKFLFNNNDLDLEKSVADLGLENNANIFCRCKSEKKFTLQFNVNRINENDNNIDNIDNNIDEEEENEKQNKCINILSYKNIKLKDLIDDLICNCRLNEDFFRQQVKNGNLYIGNKAVSSDDYEKTISEFLEWDNNDNRTDIKVNAVMQGVSSLYDIRERRFALQNDNEYFSAVACCPLETLSTVIERWCHANQFRSDKFINLMKSDQVKLIVGKYALGKEVLNSPIKDINGINLNETVLEMKLDAPDINLKDIKAEGFGMYFKVLDSEKEFYINDLNETQTLKEIIQSVGDVLGNPSYDDNDDNIDNIVAQIRKGNLEIIKEGINVKKHVFKKSDLEKPFYEIVGDINEFNVNNNDKTIIKFQISSLEIAKDGINNIYGINQGDITMSGSNIGLHVSNMHSANKDLITDCRNNKSKKSNWFKTLICLAIIFAALSILAFALKLALALKIIFLGIGVICCIGSIVSINLSKEEKPTGKNDLRQKFDGNNIIEKTKNLNQNRNDTPINIINECEDKSNNF